MSILAELNHRGEGRIDPWDYLDPSAVPTVEGRSVVVNARVQARVATAKRMLDGAA